MNSFSILQYYGWAPGLESMNDTLLWAEGKKKILDEPLSPDISHLPPIARRRLSQLSKMVLHVGHHLLGNEEIPTILCSQYGEINQQYKITKGILIDGEVRPSNFSLSVFNTPLSLLSIHEKNHKSNSVLLGGASGLVNGLVAGLSRLNSSSDSRVLLIFADESLPEEYRILEKVEPKAYAFGLVLSKSNSSSDKIQFQIKSCDHSEKCSPLSLYRWLLMGKKDILKLQDCGQELLFQGNNI